MPFPAMAAGPWPPLVFGEQTWQRLEGPPPRGQPDTIWVVTVPTPIGPALNWAMMHTLGRGVNLLLSGFPPAIDHVDSRLGGR